VSDGYRRLLPAITCQRTPRLITLIKTKSYKPEMLSGGRGRRFKSSHPDQFFQTRSASYNSLWMATVFLWGHCVGTFRVPSRLSLEGLWPRISRTACRSFRSAEQGPEPKNRRSASVCRVWYRTTLKSEILADHGAAQKKQSRTEAFQGIMLLLSLPLLYESTGMVPISS
jgi:hypothetical protein